jgi:hypothetical protein
MTKGDSTMVGFGTLEPVIVTALRSWENRRGDTIRVVQVKAVGATEAEEATEFYVSPSVDGELPPEGEIVHIRLGARARGWETEVYPDGSRKRRNRGTSYAVRAFVPATNGK